jgi:hypothetical protein
VAAYVPAAALFTVQVAFPEDSDEAAHFGEPGPVSDQVSDPVGVTPDPVTVAVKVKLPPTDTDLELSAIATVGLVRLWPA